MRYIGVLVNERGNVLLEYRKLAEKLVHMSTNGMVPYLCRDRGKERSLYAKRILVSAAC